MTKDTTRQLRECVLWTVLAAMAVVACAMCFRYCGQLFAVCSLVLAVAVGIACVCQWVLFGFLRKKDKIDGLLEKDGQTRKKRRK